MEHGVDTRVPPIVIVSQDGLWKINKIFATESSNAVALIRLEKAKQFFLRRWSKFYDPLAMASL